MSPLRVALLSLCTLLVGAGLGYGGSQLLGSDGGGGGESTAAITTAAVTGAEGGDGFAACRQDETFGCYQRAFKVLVDA